MSFDYSSALNAARAQIADKGRDVVYSLVTDGVYDPATNTRTAGAPTEATIKAVVSDVSIKQVDGALTLLGDKMLLVAGDAIAPELSARIVDGADTYKVVHVEEVKAGDTAVLYKIQIRK